MRVIIKALYHVCVSIIDFKKKQNNEPGMIYFGAGEPCHPRESTGKNCSGRVCMYRGGMPERDEADLVRLCRTARTSEQEIFG